MAYNWKDARSKRINDNIALRRELSLRTPGADIVDTKRGLGQKTLWGDLLGYKTPSPDPENPYVPAPPGPSLTAKEVCDRRRAGGEDVQWQVNTLTGLGQCVPIDKGLPTGEDKLPPVGELDKTLPGGIPASLNPNDITVPQDQTPVPYASMGPYGQAFADMLSTPAFGGQTLEELENARIAALQGDLQNQYGYQADELTRRLNREAGGAGMFTSDTRVGAIGQGLSELGRQQQVELAKGSADIRGQRPELLLQEREQRSQIANMWGQMDQGMQQANLDAMLNNKLMEYERQAKNGTLTIDAFEGNINKMALFLKYMVSKAQTQNDTAMLSAQIDKWYGEMTLEQQRQFREWTFQLMNAENYGGLGNG